MVEMKPSGVQWIGDIPSEWKLGKVKNRFYSTKTIVGDKVDDYERLALTLGGVIKRSKEANDGLQPEKFDGYQILRENELVFKLIDLANVATSRVGLSPYTGIVSPAYTILHDRKNGCPRYAEYYFLSMWMNEVFNHLGGDGVRSSLNVKDLLNVPFPLISETEQQAIADYLDDRCTKLDEIITEAEKSIEEYKELKQAVIFEAVTKGLDKKNVKMKDSGVEWLPHIPASWDVRRIASVYEESKETGRDDLPILLVSIHTGISDREVDNDERDRKVIRSEDKTVYKVVHKNYLVYNMMRAWQGGFGAATVDGLVSPAYVVAKPKIEVNSSYVEHVLRTPNAIEHIRGLSYGVADFRLRLYWPYFKNIKVPLPPIEEQNKIVSYIQDQSNKMDALISEKQGLIEDLKSYKKYEVVTGKRRVV